MHRHYILYKFHIVFDEFFVHMNYHKTTILANLVIIILRARFAACFMFSLQMESSLPEGAMTVEKLQGKLTCDIKTWKAFLQLAGFTINVGNTHLHV